MHLKDIRQHAVVRPWLQIDALAAARFVTWTLIGGLFLFFYFGVS